MERTDFQQTVEQCVNELIKDGWIQTKKEGKELFKNALTYTVVQDAIVEQMKFLADEDRHWTIEGKGDDFEE